MIRTTILSMMLVAPVSATIVDAPPASAPTRVESDAAEELRRDWLRRVEDARAQYEDFAARASADAKAASENGAYATPSHISHLLDDTLRAGDVVATPDGLLVFKGSRAFPHEIGDFEPLGAHNARLSPHGSALLEYMRATTQRRP
jgi:hypothetical protein